MKGAKGLQNVVSIGNELSKRCDIDLLCSYHIHIGNIPTTRSFLSALYILCYKIQDELFTMFPYYKTNPEGLKDKNHNQKLKKRSIHPLKDETKGGYKQYVNDVYNKIFLFLSCNSAPSAHCNRKQKRHPIKQKWGITSRYFFVNLLNALFSERNTLELRIHEGTLNPQKMVNCLFLFNAILKYAQNNERKIFTTEGKISLEEVVNYYKVAFKGNEKAEFLSDYLNAYCTERKEYFKKDLEAGDVLSKKWMMEDKDYQFTYQGVSSLF